MLDAYSQANCRYASTRMAFENHFNCATFRFQQVAGDIIITSSSAVMRPTNFYNISGDKVLCHPDVMVDTYSPEILSEIKLKSSG